VQASGRRALVALEGCAQGVLRLGSAACGERRTSRTILERRPALRKREQDPKDGALAVQ